MILALALSLACTNEGSTDNPEPFDTQVTRDDLDGPEISHVQVSSPQPMGDDIFIEATIIDETQVLVAAVKFRRQTAEAWENAALVLVDPETGLYRGKLSADDLGSGGMHYYFEAVDTLQNTSVWPEAAPEEFFKFDLYAE